MGSKSRVAKYIVPIIQNEINTHNIETYIEPFCGGCNIIDKIVCKNKIASDNQKFLISLYQNLDKLIQLPEFVTKEHYSDVRDCFNNRTDRYPDWYVGAIGFLASYNGRFFDGGYAGLVHTKSGSIRNYYDEAKRNLLDQVNHLKGIEFQYGDYEELYSDIKNTLIYCDPPYQNTKKYGVSKKFDYERFWQWAERMSNNNIVLVSEHIAPDRWECVWKQEVKRTIDNNKRVRAVECLFRIFTDGMICWR